MKSGLTRYMQLLKLRLSIRCEHIDFSVQQINGSNVSVLVVWH